MSNPSGTVHRDSVPALLAFVAKQLGCRGDLPKVPEYLETAMYASYVELMDPFFLEIALPQISGIC